MSPLGGNMWTGAELRAEKVPFNKIWSLVDGDDGTVHAEAGRRHVNATGSIVVTEKGWEDPQQSAVWAALDDEL